MSSTSSFRHLPIAQVPALASALHIAGVRIESTRKRKALEQVLAADTASDRFLGILRGAMAAELAGGPVPMNAGAHAPVHACLVQAGVSSVRMCHP